MEKTDGCSILILYLSHNMVIVTQFRLIITNELMFIDNYYWSYPGFTESQIPQKCFCAYLPKLDSSKCTKSDSSKLLREPFQSREASLYFYYSPPGSKKAHRIPWLEPFSLIMAIRGSISVNLLSRIDYTWTTGKMWSKGSYYNSIIQLEFSCSDPKHLQLHCKKGNFRSH